MLHLYFVLNGPNETSDSLLLIRRGRCLIYLVMKGRPKIAKLIICRIQCRVEGSCEDLVEGLNYNRFLGSDLEVSVHGICFHGIEGFASLRIAFSCSMAWLVVRNPFCEYCRQLIDFGIRQFWNYWGFEV